MRPVEFNRAITPRGIQARREQEDNSHRTPEFTVLMHSSYPLRTDTPSGVASFTLELGPYLEKEGIRVWFVGPRIRDEAHNAAHYTLGRIPPKGLTLNQTTTENAVSFNKRLAREIVGEIDANGKLVIVYQEPFAGHAAHTLSSALEKRPDGKPVATVIGHFHAQTENLTTVYKYGLKLLPMVRRVQFQHGIFPFRFSMGYGRTITDNLAGRIAVSKATASFWDNLFPGDYEIIYNGIATEEFTPDGPKIERWDDGRKTVFLTGRHDQRKGIEYVIEAFALMPWHLRERVKVKIGGEGKMTKKLKQMVQDLGLGTSIEFLGVLPRSDLTKSVDLIRAYRRADLFVSASTGGEGFGRVIAEALSSGTPVVVTDINGHREVVGNGEFARMVQPQNPLALMQAVVRSLSIPDEEQKRRGLLGRAHVEANFAWPIISRKTAEFYRRRITTHGARAADIFVSGRGRDNR